MRHAALLPAALALATLLVACAPATRVTLLPQPDKPHAAVEVKTKDGTVVLGQPYAVADVAAHGTISTEQTTPQVVNQRYGQLLSVQPAPAQHFTLYFELGGSQLTAESNNELADVLQRATERPGGEIVVIGHTDRVGTVQANDALSLQRALAIRQLIVERGFSPARVEAVGRGEREPAVSTDDEVQEPRNRRAEILVR